MFDFTVYKLSNGRILRTGRVRTLEDVRKQAKAGEAVLLGKPPGRGYSVVDGEFVLGLTQEEQNERDAVDASRAAAAVERARDLAALDELIVGSDPALKTLARILKRLKE